MNIEWNNNNRKLRGEEFHQKQIECQKKKCSKRRERNCYSQAHNCCSRISKTMLKTSHVADPSTPLNLLRNICSQIILTEVLEVTVVKGNGVLHYYSGKLSRLEWGKYVWLGKIFLILTFWRCVHQLQSSICVKLLNLQVLEQFSGIMVVFLSIDVGKLITSFFHWRFLVNYVVFTQIIIFSRFYNY